MPLHKISTVVRNNYTDDRVLSLADLGGFVDMQVADANSVTVPPQTDVAWPADAEIIITQLGAGLTSILSGAGVAIYTYDSRNDLAGQYASCTLTRLAEDSWLLVGNLA